MIDCFESARSQSNAEKPPTTNLAEILAFRLENCEFRTLEHNRIQLVTLHRTTHSFDKSELSRLPDVDICCLVKQEY